MKYQIGDIEFLEDDDPYFDSYEAALRAAAKMWLRLADINPNEKHFIGIWRDPDGRCELIGIYHDGEMYGNGTGH